MRKLFIKASATIKMYEGQLSKFITEKRTIFAKKQTVITEHLYLNDIPVSSRKEDKFQFSQMADLIMELLEQGQLPLHIGLLGSWGTGKTSVLKLLEARVNAGSRKQQRYFIKFINVWKFADDAPSLHRKIVREVESQLKVENAEGITHETSSQISKKTSGFWAIFDKKNFKKYGLVLTTYIVTLIFITILYEWLFSFKDPWALAFTNTTSLLIIMIAYTIFNKSSLEFTHQETTKEIALQHGDQFEYRFEIAVTNYLKANKGKRLILVFDDLDRLPPKQLVAALNTIKTFLRSDQCAFIVPCDEENLHEGISNAFNDKNMSNFSVTEFLNKTFDLQLHLPFVEKINMRSYAKEVLKEQKVKWILHPNIPLDRILGVLIHSGIRTPRQVKKVLNAYAFDWYLAQKRDLEAGIDFLSKHPLGIAIFSVLKTDFPKYFQLISQEPSLINKPLEDQLKKIKDINTDGEESSQNFEFLQHLEAFLSRVETIIPNDPRPYIYFNNQLLNPLTGRPELEKTKEYLLNGQSDKFKDSFFALPESDKIVVMSASLEDLDVSDGVLVDNCLKILIEHNDALKYTQDMDWNRWEKLFVENINVFSDFAILEVCRALENIGVQDSTRIAYGKSLNAENNSEELFELWLKFPNYIEYLQINHIGDNIISGYRKAGKIHLLANTIESIKSNNHTLLDNNKFDWLEVLTYSVLSDNLPTLLLHDWLIEWSQKTGSIVTCKIINSVLDEFSFKNEDYLVRIGELWIKTYDQFPSQEDMNKILSLMSSANFSGFSDEDLIKISEYIDDLDYKTISRLVNKIFSAWWKIDTEKTIDLMKLWKNTPGVGSFALSIFSLELDEESLFLVTTILRDREDRLPKDNNLIEQIQNEIIKAQEQSQRTPAIGVIEILVQNATWKKKIDQYIENWFPLSNNSIWLSWHENVVRDRLALLYYLSNDKLDDWLLECIFNLFRVSQGVLAASGGYQNYAPRYLNILVDRIIEKDSIDWEHTVELLVNISLQNGNHGSLFASLEVPTIEKLLTELNRYCAMDNKTYNELLVQFYTPSSKNHTEAALKRWEFLNKIDRERFIQNLNTSEELKDQFGQKLSQSFTLRPDLDYIDELITWGFNNNTTINIINTIIKNVDLDSLNSWIPNAFTDLIKAMDKWKFNALQIAIRTREGINLPDKSIFEEALSMNDDRSKISLELIKTDRKTAASLKDSIMSLRDAYPDEVEEIRNKFKWKKA